MDSPFSHKAFAAQKGIGIKLLSDFNREAGKAYEVLYEDLLGLQGVSKRAAVVVDKEGIVRYAEECPTPRDLPNLESIRATVQSMS